MRGKSIVFLKFEFSCSNSYMCVLFPFLSYRYFMISGLNGSGVKDLVQYLMDQVSFLCLAYSEINRAKCYLLSIPSPRVNSKVL